MAQRLDLAERQPTPSQCIGPDYRDSDLKPTATVSKSPAHDNVTVLSQTPQLIALLTCVPSPLWIYPISDRLPA